MPLRIAEKIREKLLNKHHVQIGEVLECFLNRSGPDLLDQRERHASDPPTRWFIAQTNKRRLLKIVYIPREDGIHIRTAYDANPAEIAIYRRHADGC